MPETHGKAHEIFKKTREERGLSLPDVAHNLHLTVTMIEQIEAGDVTDRHLAPVFMRGYVRSYAKFLNLPESLVDEMISPLSVENPVKTPAKPKKEYIKQESQLNGKQPPVHNSKKVLFYLLVVALLIIIASFWHGTNKVEVPEESTLVIESPENTLSQPETLSTEENTLTTPTPEENTTLAPSEEPTQTLEENAPLVSNEEAPQTIETPTEAVPETSPAPMIETPPPPVEPIAPPPAKKILPPSKTIPTPSQPEVIDAQETP